jgi:cytochrome c biogenesis protein CcmG, thiol:disulfide interchange protein DsbE
MNWRVMGLGLLLSVPLIWVLAQGFRYDPRALPEALVGQEAPDFVLTSLDGYEVSLSDISGGPVVINFWASWCKPCLQEHAELSGLAEKYKAKGVVFLGVLYGDTEQDAKNFVRQHGASFPSLMDPTQRTCIDYGVSGVPETYILNNDGLIVRKITGPINPHVLEIESILDGML